MRTPRDPIRLIIADDHALFRAGMRSVLQLHDDLTIVGETDRVGALAELAAQTACDVVLLDLQMERSSLLEIAKLRRRTRIIVVTASEQLDDMLMAMRLGARGVVLKHFAMEALVEAICAVAAGEIWLPPALKEALARRDGEPKYKGLTRREYEIARHAALGLRNVEIARRLLISEVTVKTHLTSVFQKLGIRDRVQLARYAITAGIVRAHETPS
ncbi:MAG TPA: response regulator transcription factor [Candidatus Binatia bacterium]|jgi:DNA-binding NarL/FixJ family response regulator